MIAFHHPPRRASREQRVLVGWTTRCCCRAATTVSAVYRDGAFVHRGAALHGCANLAGVGTGPLFFFGGRISAVIVSSIGLGVLGHIEGGLAERVRANLTEW